METYKIIRFRRDAPSKTIMRGLTLKDAREHCSDERTHGTDWFDGYTKE